jgi:hypothetical protein
MLNHMKQTGHVPWAVQIGNEGGIIPAPDNNYATNGPKWTHHQGQIGPSK